jgi:hypothetical protein
VPQVSGVYWSRSEEPFSEEDVAYYAKIVSKVRTGLRVIHTQTGMEELTEEEYAEFLIKEWTDSPRGAVWDMIEHLLK